MLVYPGDQFIVRSVTPVTTIGGGRVIDPAAHKHGTGPQWRERLALLEEGAPDAIAALLLEESFPSYLLRGRLEASPYLWRFAPRHRAAVAGLLADGRAVVAGVAAGPPAAATAPDTGRARGARAGGRQRRSGRPLEPSLPRPLVPGSRREDGGHSDSGGRESRRS